jgi:hypothetical protein
MKNKQKVSTPKSIMGNYQIVFYFALVGLYAATQWVIFLAPLYLLTGFLILVSALAIIGALCLFPEKIKHEKKLMNARETFNYWAMKLVGVLLAYLCFAVGHPILSLQFLICLAISSGMRDVNLEQPV